MRSRLNRKRLLSWACDAVETVVARHLWHWDRAVEHLNQFATEEERRFAFHCVWLPLATQWALEKAFSSAKGRGFYVPEFGLVLAHSRMLWEMRAWELDPRFVWWRGPQHTSTACRWATELYDSHLVAIKAAYCHWMRRKCPDCSHDQPELARASRYGFAQRVDSKGVPAKFLGELLAFFKERERDGSRETEFFYKNASPNVTETRWDQPDIDLWLIEIWPLVERYGWTYVDVYRLALAKFGERDDVGNSRVLDRANALAERCESLGLHLSDLGRRRPGRPKDYDPSAVPAYFADAVYPKYEELAKGSDEKTQAHGPGAFRALAELALDIEPFTRLLSGQSSERWDFALPRLLKGGQKTGAGPPFFEPPALYSVGHDAETS